MSNLEKILVVLFCISFVAIAFHINKRVDCQMQEINQLDIKIEKLRELKKHYNGLRV